MHESLYEGRARCAWEVIEGCQDAFDNWESEWSFIWEEDLEIGQMGSDIRKSMRHRLLIMGLGLGEFNEIKRAEFQKAAKAYWDKRIGREGD